MHACPFDPPSTFIVRESYFNLGGIIEKSYGFPFVEQVSMKMLLTFEPEVFVKLL